MLVFSVRADNPYCALLDYDLQYLDGKRWKTIEEVRTPLPASDLVNTPQCRATTWYLDENFFVHRFRPVTTDRLRLVVRRTTHGFMTDELAVKAAGWSANSPHLMLREIEIYGPPPPVEVTLAAKSTAKTEAFEREAVTMTLRNHGKMRLEGRALVRVPKGWKASPAALLVAAAPGATEALDFDLMPPPGPIAVGLVAVDVLLTDRKNAVLDFDRLTLQLAPPVAVTPRSPDKIDAAGQEMPVLVKNLTDRPVSGRVMIELTPAGAAEGAKVLRAEAPFGPVAKDQAVTVAPLVPGLDLLHSGWHAVYTVTGNNLAIRLPQDVAQVRPWQVLGPFPNLTGRAFDKDFGPEKGPVDLSQTYTVAGRSEPIRWKPTLSATTGYVDLTRLFTPNILVCAYAVTYVKSPTARKALVSAGSDDGGKTWLNGKLILSKPGARSAAPGQDKAEVELKEGWNEVLIKIPQSHGGWGFYFELLTLQGKAMPDLVYEAQR
jgi:hypothetical protein